MLLTISSSRLSISSLETSPQGRGMVLRVSNLYPKLLVLVYEPDRKWALTPVLHQVG